MKKEASNSTRDDLIQHLSAPIPFDISIDVYDFEELAMLSDGVLK